MHNEKLVEQVIAEVLRRLEQKSKSDAVKVLALFTGGTIGVSEGLAELKKIKSLGADISVVLSVAAEKVIGKEQIRQYLGNEIQVITSNDDYPGSLLQEADLVLVPVLTQNTAAKIANTLADTLITTLIMQALMQGKPVIAAKNAADPQDAWKAVKGMRKAAPGLTQALLANLKKMESYGAKLIHVERLAAECQSILACKVEKPVMAAGKNIIDAQAVKAVAANGIKRLAIVSGGLVTPLAWDVAKDYNIEIIVDNS